MSDELRAGPDSNDIEHVPVMLTETLHALHLKPHGRYVDGTVGLGGHASAILEHSTPKGRLLGIDSDSEALNIAKARLSTYGSRVTLVQGSFRDLNSLCQAQQFAPVDGILLDLGLCSLHLSQAERGFSFRSEGPLDMRFDRRSTTTAGTIVNTYSETDLAALLRAYGEERRARRIARQIVKERPISTTLQLASIVTKALGKCGPGIHPATRTFQALRIAVNQELENLAEALEQVVALLAPEGRIVVISYHSLEDRIVKAKFAAEAKGCLCPPELPQCICGRVPTLRVITKKPIAPSPAEIAANPRSRSARLRVSERLPGS